MIFIINGKGPRIIARFFYIKYLVSFTKQLPIMNELCLQKFMGVPSSVSMPPQLQ